ncbi:MAG: single-stranded DNA-binding protein [Chitinispirillaceae bacterium]|nr:single-stranded DNA-binding protein [Chitinispirillaceae bacterium]
MIGVNKVILIGNLGKDPELRYTPAGQAVATFTLATTERWSDRNGQRQDRTEWHNIVAWGRLGELVSQYLKKGRSAYVEGRISTRTWEDKDGNKRYRTEIIANQIQFLGPYTGGTNGEPPLQESIPEYLNENSTSDSVSSDIPVVEDDLPF